MVQSIDYMAHKQSLLFRLIKLIAFFHNMSRAIRLKVKILSVNMSEI